SMSTFFAAAGFLQHLAVVRPLYVAIWCALGVAGIALVALMQSKWGRANTLHRCAILAGLGHVGLADLARRVRLGVGWAGAGGGAGGGRCRRFMCGSWMMRSARGR